MHGTLVEGFLKKQMQLVFTQGIKGIKLTRITNKKGQSFTFWNVELWAPFSEKPRLGWTHLWAPFQLGPHPWALSLCRF